jgi:hypothetical protein
LNEEILHAIDEELAKLRQVRAILTDSGQATPTRKSARTSRTSSPAVAGAKPRRTLSPKARRAIAEAQRKRWAKVKSLKKAATQAAAAKKESSAG